MKKNAKDVLGILVLMLLFLWYILNVIVDQKREMENRWDKEERQKQMSYYIPVDVNISFDKGSRGMSTGVHMYLYSSSLNTEVQCPYPLDLDLDTRYVTQAPRGNIIFEDDSWYIAKVLTKFASKDEVKKHIRSCAPLLLEVHKKEVKQKEKNLKSWAD